MKLISSDSSQSIEDIISKNRDMEATFYNTIEEIEQNLLIRYVESVKKFNKAYFTNKQESLRQQRKQEGNDIASLIAKINENYLKNGNNIDSAMKDEDMSEGEYEVEKRDNSSKSHTPYNCRPKRSLHNKTTRPSNSTLPLKYKENKLQSSSSRVPFKIFDQNQRTPCYNQNMVNDNPYDNMDVDEVEEDPHNGAKVSEFSVWNTESITEHPERPKAHTMNKKLMLPSERLKTVPGAKAELLEANAFNITVKITPPANEVHVQNNIINIQANRSNRKRHRKPKYRPGYVYSHAYKPYLNDIKEEMVDSESEHEYESRYPYKFDKHSKIYKKMQYKRSREMLQDTPPMLYKLGNMVKRQKRHEGYGYEPALHEYDPHQTYYVIPSNHIGYGQYPGYEAGYYQGLPSPMAYKHDKKRGKERLAPFYHPVYGIAPVAICPGCGGKKNLIPTRTPAKQIQAPQHDYEHDFLEKISPSAFTPLRSKHNSESKHSSGEIMYPNFLSPAQPLRKINEVVEIKEPKEEKLSYPFSSGDSKHMYKPSPTPIKKSIPFMASATKIYKEDLVPDLNNNLFSQDLGGDENNKSPFSFLKSSKNLSNMPMQTKNREAFNNITNTLNKSPFFEEKEVNKKNLEN